MTAEKLRGYRFSTEEQWNECLFVQGDRETRGTKPGLRPFAPYSSTSTRFGPAHAHAPATLYGEVFWRDEAGHMLRMGPRHEEPEAVPAPRALARAKRTVVNAQGLWCVADPPGVLLRHEADTLTHLSTREIPGARILDIAGDGHDAVFALVAVGEEFRAVRIECGERIGKVVTFDGLSHAREFVWLRRAARFVVLSGDHHQRLYWYAATGGTPLSSIAVGGLNPCFEATALGSDGRNRVFLAGRDGEDFKGRAWVFSFDGDGLPAGEKIPLEAPATGITATRDDVWVTTASGLLQHSTADRVPGEAGELRAMLITPALHSPDREDQRRWLRIEAAGDLPAGATLEIAHASTNDPAVRERLASIAADESVPESVRAQRLVDEPDFWKPAITFQGSDEPSGDSRAPFSAPLFDVHDSYVWVRVTLTAAAGAKLPALRELVVVYPGRTLMENLPDVYQREESKPGSFLRALVGVLESTTQDLDRRIDALGSHAQPSSADAEWLDFVARWLGLPWDDALPTAKKRALLRGAPHIAKYRGTRTGLEALLECLIPGTPRRFKVSDDTADVGFAIVGDDAHRGSALPAMLAGVSLWNAELGSRSVVGRMRLPCPNERDDSAWQWVGRIRVDVAATAEERAELEPWLLALVQDMVPLTARVALRWLTARALRTNRLGDDLVLEAEDSAQLGTGAITSEVRLPAGASKLSATGPIGDIRLH